MGDEYSLGCAIITKSRPCRRTQADVPQDIVGPLKSAPVVPYTCGYAHPSDDPMTQLELPSTAPRPMSLTSRASRCRC